MSLLVACQRLETVRARVELEFPAERDLGHARVAEWRRRGHGKYGEPFWHAELAKLRLRARYARDRAAAGFLERSFAFWQQYEDLNRLWLPTDPVYSGSRGGVALSTTADHCTLTAGASGMHRVLEAYIAGEATSSAVARVCLNYPSAAGTTPTNQTPEKFNSRSPANVSTYATTWSTHPTLSTNDVALFGFNAFGGSERWIPPHGAEISRLNSEALSMRSRSGTSTVSSHLIWEEL